MKLNRHKRKYVDQTPPKRSRIVDAQGGVYHPIPAPAGLCKCGIMMALKPQNTDYVFPSAVSARHAISHTMTYLKSINIEFNPKDYFVEEVK